LLSYEYPSRNHSESGWTFSMHHADELLSPNVWKNDSMGGILISKWAVKKEFDLSKNVLRNIFG
jgi:hypothetical protein